MKTKIFTLFICLLTYSGLFSQGKGPYSINHSTEFEDPDDMFLFRTTPYADGNILLTFINSERFDKIGLQLFSPDLKQVKVATPDLKSMFPNKKSYFDGVKIMDKKSYLYVREVYKDTKTEGMSAVEFSPTTLELIGTPIKLFQSTRGIKNSNFGYSTALSGDRTKLFYKYDLFDKEKGSPGNQEYGFYMFDDNMKQIWGGEYELPSKMSPRDYDISNDGKLYYLMQVYGDPAKQFALLVYDKDKKDPKVIDIPTENHDFKTTYLSSDKSGNLVIAGFYSKKDNPYIDGAYVLRLDPKSGKFTNLGGGYYEIPGDIIKSYTSDREKRKLEKKEDKTEGDESKDLGIANLKIRSLNFMDDGSVAIVSEVFSIITTTHTSGTSSTSYTDVFADEIFVFNFDPAGKLAYIKKIPKRQRGAGEAKDISISSTVKNNHVHIFYSDNPANFSLNENEPPKTFRDETNGIITCVDIDEKGEVKKYNLGEMNQFEANIHLRDFSSGRKNNMIAVEKKKKKNVLFSIDIK